MTYSIVARDKETGELGVAVESHFFQVGPVVPWAIAGVGAVATQSNVNISFGPIALDYLRAGYTAEQALRALLAADTQPDVRQVAIVDAHGNVAVHTGENCIPAAGHRAGDGFSVQANLMEKDTVWDAMHDAFSATREPMAERMMAALEAAEAEGGDIRGRQSAAMLVVTGKPTGRSWEDRTIDLRVEDAPDPWRSSAGFCASSVHTRRQVGGSDWSVPVTNRPRRQRSSMHCQWRRKWSSWRSGAGWGLRRQASSTGGAS